MRRVAFPLALLIAIAPIGADARRDAAPQTRSSAPPAGPVAAQVSVCFVPAQQCDTAITAAIDAARDSIRVQAYGFTAPRILRALAAAHDRGIDVQIILDKSNEPEGRQVQSAGASFTRDVGIPTWIDDTVAIAHNKLIVIDGHLVIGGSYNYTSSAERRNAENVTFIDSPAVAAMYLANWDLRRAVSKSLQTQPGGPAAFLAAPAPLRN
ncbi:MAG: phospholipase D family protein [Rhodospirillales bacterium]|nr:phospholipase D family protein [Rhodospirillales bacterium]